MTAPPWLRERAHPRSRGEHAEHFVGRVRRRGSSPLARGAHATALQFGSSAGLIPARAGSTAAPRMCVLLGWAHPRSRGEHIAGVSEDKYRAGSSPLARGALFLSVGSHRARGLIPARAGSTPTFRLVGLLDWAHPRSRGEHASDAAVGDHAVGSSPLARGARGTLNVRLKICGLIPARAGSTPRRSLPEAMTRAHPRSRGEHSEEIDFATPEPGSSPLARGARMSLKSDRIAYGLIPARAGSTPRK